MDMNEKLLTEKAISLSGFLAPDGTFTECESWEHTDTAKIICEEKYNKEFLSGIKAEDFLYDQGYCGFYARGASHRFLVNVNENEKAKDAKKKRVCLLTDEQHDFIISNLANANNDDQKAEIEEMLEWDSEYREESALKYYEDKYTK